ncbi:MAG: hypothetical protein HOJ88_05050 [Proteobacteria bacterium]|jgi:hypothetical protein|nr:hypothetical protein [Pseudomonadota bacterium]
MLLTRILHRTNKGLMFRLTVFILLLSSLAGCISAPPTTADWPSNLPPRELYETAWAQDTANQEVQSLNAYLRWVLRFYQGWPVYDYGWLDITRDVLASIQEPAEKESVAEQLIEMGQLISLEWSKDSPDRYIRTPTISTWGDALREAIEREEVQALTIRLFEDIDKLANQQISITDITLERYYDTEEEDFF